MEIWKDIKGYEGLYQASSLGNVKSMNYKRTGTERLLVKTKSRKEYEYVSIWKEGFMKTIAVHRLVAIAFLAHNPCRYNIVVDHKNNIKNDNRVVNLQLLTHRKNTSKDRNGTSKYVGVSWNKRDKKWRAQIQINGKTKFLASCITEIEASFIYQKALKELIKTQP